MLRFDDVSFGYRRSAAPVLHGLTLDWPTGRTVLLGPNGAGKSTALALAAGALLPARGRILAQGADSRTRRDRARYRRLVGWMPQTIPALPGLTAREQVAYAAWLKGLSRKRAWSEAGSALDAVGLSGAANQRTAHLSGGQLRRVGLAQLLAHDCRVMLLDEPTAGLDPAQRQRFRNLIGEIGGDRSILVSTHQVDDLDEMFDTVVVLHAGVIRFVGSVHDFLALAPRETVRRAEAAYGELVGVEA